MVATPLPPPAFACVVAADRARGIGRDNHLPWPRLRGDLRHLKRITSDTRGARARNAVLLGRRTWESIPKRAQPLPDRINVVISRSELDLPRGVLAAASLDEALAAAVRVRAEQIFVLGGGQLFVQAVEDPRCRVIYYTRVLGRFRADTFFPPFEQAFAREETGLVHHEAGVRYQIERWLRKP
jgi:dihydrofolate reductase